MTANRKDVKNKDILTLLDAVWEPESVAVIHCQGQWIPPRLREADWQIRPLNKQLRAWG